MKSGATCRYSVLILAFFTINILVGSFIYVDSAQSADLLSSYNILKNQYPNYINKLMAGGASEAQIESFLKDLDDNVRLRGDLNDANFDNIMYEALQEVITAREHRTLFKAMVSQFKEEIDYTTDTHSLHSNLVPLRNAVKASVLNEIVTPPNQPEQPGNDNQNNTGGGDKNLPGNTESSSTGGGSTGANKQDDIPALTPNPDNENLNGMTFIEKFTDLNDHWAKNEIAHAIQLGLAYGISPTQFAPDCNITRAEFAVLLTRAIGLKNTTCIQSRFSDVTTDAWYFDGVNTAAEVGLVSGYTLSTFAPDELITREQMAVMISRTLAYKGKQLNNNDLTLANFIDRKDISSWALEGVTTVVQLEIVKGRSADIFAPRQNATRAEATAMILRMYKQL